MTTQDYKKKKARSLFVDQQRTLEFITKKLDIPYGTLQRWRCNDGWVAARKNKAEKEYDPKPLAKTQIPFEIVQEPLVLPITAPRNDDDVLSLSEEDSLNIVHKWEASAACHEECFAEMRKLGRKMISIMTDDVRILEYEGNFEDLKALAYSVSTARSMVEWAKLVDVGVRGERVATSADYLDINKAVALVKAYDYEITHKVQVEENAEELGGVSDEFRGVVKRQLFGESTPEDSVYLKTGKLLPESKTDDDESL